MDYDPSNNSDDNPPSHQNTILNGGKLTGIVMSIGGSSYEHANIQQMIRNLEQEAYTAVLRAFGAQSENITWAKERLMSDLRKELRVSDEEHREFLGIVAGDTTLRQIQEWRSSGGNHLGTVNGSFFPDGVPSPAVSALWKKQKTSHTSQASLPPIPASVSLLPGSVPCFVLPSATAAKRPFPAGSRGKKGKAGRPIPVTSSSLNASIHEASPMGKSSGFGRGSNLAATSKSSLVDSQSDPWIGRSVKTRWPDDNTYYEAVVTDYDPEKALHVLTYDMNTDQETWEWVNLKELSPSDLIVVDAPLVPVGGKIPPFGSIRKTGVRGSHLAPATARAKGPSKCLATAFNKSALPLTLPRNCKDLSPRGMEMKDMRQVSLPSLEALIKEVDSVIEEEDLAKLESIKRAAKEREEMIRKALAEVGESSDEGDSDGLLPSSHRNLMKLEGEWERGQGTMEQGCHYIGDNLVEDCRLEQSDVLAGEAGTASDDE